MTTINGQTLREKIWEQESVINEISRELDDETHITEEAEKELMDHFQNIIAVLLRLYGTQEMINVKIRKGEYTIKEDAE